MTCPNFNVEPFSDIVTMKHGAKAYAKKLGRTPQHRIDLARNLVSQLLHHEQIVTTVAKAKFVKPVVERVGYRREEYHFSGLARSLVIPPLFRQVSYLFPHQTMSHQIGHQLGKKRR